MAKQFSQGALTRSAGRTNDIDTCDPARDTASARSTANTRGTTRRWTQRATASAAPAIVEDTCTICSVSETPWSIGGHDKGMEAHYVREMETILTDCRYDSVSLQVRQELFFVVDRR